MEIKVGCCGFAERKEDYFKHFSLVEIQETFYQPPLKIETAKKWRESAPKNFEFTLKAWQIITHPFDLPTYKRLKEKIGNPQNYGFFKNTKEVFRALERTKEIAKVLKAKIIVFQTLSSFEPKKESIENLRNFFKKTSEKNFIFAWEPRGDWDAKLIKNLCQELNLIRCVDPFKRKSVFGQINYYRLHGLPDYNLSYQYTEKDLKEILKFCDKGKNYILFNNLTMFSDAQKFQALLK